MVSIRPFREVAEGGHLTDGDIALFPTSVLLGCGGFEMASLLGNVGLG